MPTIWDPNLSELAQACTDAGHRPTNPADPGDVYRCAVEALADAEERSEWLSPEEHEKALDEERKAGKDEGKEEAEEEAEKEQKKAKKRIEELEGDLLAAQQDLAALRAALEGDEAAGARALLAAQQAAQEVCQVFKDRAQDIADRLRRWADELERPRARKAAVVAGMRLTADWLEQGAGEGDE